MKGEGGGGGEEEKRRKCVIYVCSKIFSNKQMNSKTLKIHLRISFPPLGPQFLNCTSASSFQQPQVHCVGDLVGFQNLFPSYDHAGLYPGRHLPHVK